MALAALMAPLHLGPKVYHHQREVPRFVYIALI